MKQLTDGQRGQPAGCWGTMKLLPGDLVEFALAGSNPWQRRREEAQASARTVDVAKSETRAAVGRLRGTTPPAHPSGLSRRQRREEHEARVEKAKAAKKRKAAWKRAEEEAMKAKSKRGKGASDRPPRASKGWRKGVRRDKAEARAGKVEVTTRPSAPTRKRKVHVRRWTMQEYFLEAFDGVKPGHPIEYRYAHGWADPWVPGKFQEARAAGVDGEVELSNGTVISTAKYEFRFTVEVPIDPEEDIYSEGI